MNTNEIADNAAAWAQARLGETRYATKCLGFTEDAIERGNNIMLDGYSFAREAAEEYGARDDGNIPPAGAWVFYDWWGVIKGERRNWGHVGIALAGGQVIHALAEVRIDNYRDIVDLLRTSDDADPRYIGWAPLSAILERSEPHVWPA
jgi:cell wall-associated NlpC family hydrolase